MRHGPRCSSRAFLTSRFVGTSELVWTGAVGQAPALPLWYATTSELYNTYFLGMIYLHSSHNSDVATVNMDWRWIFWRCIYILSLDDFIAASWFKTALFDKRDCASVSHHFGSPSQIPRTWGPWGLAKCHWLAIWIPAYSPGNHQRSGSTQLLSDYWSMWKGKAWRVGSWYVSIAVSMSDQEVIGCLESCSAFRVHLCGCLIWVWALWCVF